MSQLFPCPHADCEHWNAPESKACWSCEGDLSGVDGTALAARHRARPSRAPVVISAVLALIGLAAAFAWFRPGSRWRLVGVAVLLLGAAYVAYLMPPGKVGPAPLEKRITFVLPALVGAALYARGFLRRRSAAAPPTSRKAWAVGPLVALRKRTVKVRVQTPSSPAQLSSSLWERDRKPW